MKISIVMAHFNDTEPLWFTIQNTINELTNNGIEFEIIVSDAGSCPGELGHIRSYIENIKKFGGHDIRMIEYTPPKEHPERLIQSCPGTRTAGIVQAKYDLICFMDSHVIVKQGFFNSMIPIFNDPDVYVVYAPMTYHAQLLYEYSIKQAELGASDNTWTSMANEPYPVAGACMACTMMRKSLLDFFFPYDELNYISYTMEEPNPSLRAWMFGKKALMNPMTHYAHSYWRHSQTGDFDFESIKPLQGYSLGGKEPYERAIIEYSTYKYKPGLKLILPEKDWEFVQKNAKVKFKDLREYLVKQGVKR